MAQSAEEVRTGSVEITEQIVRTIVDTGGYTHPLFRPIEDRDPSEGPTPLPGQGVLLLMGGLLEQSGLLDHAVALLELRSVKFFSMVRAGSVLTVDVRTGEGRRTSSGRIVQEYVWTVLDELGESVAQAEAVMLLNAESSDGKNTDQ